MADALRFDHDRMVGESYKDYAARMAGKARAAEIDRDTAVVEVERLHEEAADALVQQTTLKGMTVEEGAAVLQLGPPRELVIAWVDAARKMLGDAPNYSETRIDFPAASMEVKAAYEVERYVFTVQRAGKLTPHEARQRAEIDRDQASAELARLRAAATALVDVPAVPQQLTDDEYLRAIDLCQRAVNAHGDMSGGGPTVAGHFLGQLRGLLAGGAAGAAPAP